MDANDFFTLLFQELLKPRQGGSDNTALDFKYGLKAQSFQTQDSFQFYQNIVSSIQIQLKIFFKSFSYARFTFQCDSDQIGKQGILEITTILAFFEIQIRKKSKTKIEEMIDRIFDKINESSDVKSKFRQTILSLVEYSSTEDALTNFYKHFKQDEFYQNVVIKYLKTFSNNQFFDQFFDDTFYDVKLCFKNQREQKFEYKSLCGVGQYLWATYPSITIYLFNISGSKLNAYYLQENSTVSQSSSSLSGSQLMQVQQLQNKVNQQQQQISQLESQLEQAKNSSNNFQQKDNLIFQLQNQAQNLQKEIQQLSSKNKKLEEKFEKSQQQYIEFQSSQSYSNNREKQVGDEVLAKLNDQNAHLQEENDKLKQEQLKLKQQKDQSMAQQEQKIEQLTFQNSKLQEIENRYQRMNQQIIQLQNEKEDLKDSLKLDKKQHEETRQKQLEQIKEVEQKLMAQQQENSSLKASLANSQQNQGINDTVIIKPNYLKPQGFFVADNRPNNFIQQVQNVLQQKMGILSSQIQNSTEQCNDMAFEILNVLKQNELDTISQNNQFPMFNNNQNKNQLNLSPAQNKHLYGLLKDALEDINKDEKSQIDILNKLKIKLIYFIYYIYIDLPFLFSPAMVIENRENMIGSGGFARVFSNEIKGREYAQKLIIDTITDRPTKDLLELFHDLLNEITIMQQINSLSSSHFLNLRGISLQVSSSGKNSSTYNLELAIFTDFMENGDLQTYLNNQQLDLKEKVRIIEQLANALFIMQQFKIIHGDLKPKNILVDSNKDMKICDFGTAKVMQQTYTYKTSIPAFTIRYCPPELMQQSLKSLTTDVYSFGCMTFQIFTGQKPYPQYKQDKDINFNNAKPLLEDYNMQTTEPKVQIPQPIKQLISACCDFQYKNRPNAQQILAQISNFKKTL